MPTARVDGSQVRRRKFDPASDRRRPRRSHVERARHRAELARRRYLAVDPDNRLVADSLEAEWNDVLRQHRDAEDGYERTSAAAQNVLTEEQRVASAPWRLPGAVVGPGDAASGAQADGPPGTSPPGGVAKPDFVTEARDGPLARDAGD